MIILGIESTCDETGCALVKEGKEILSNVVSSQVDLHRAYGGVVPELACRRHVEVISMVIRQAMEETNLSFKEVDAIAVAHGPGLVGALLIGLNAAKGLSFALGKPLVGVNHVEAHLYAALMSSPTPVELPALGVVVSGGHTALLKMNGVGDYELLGQTVDDALGEAFDKVAKILGLPYPGGPQIEDLALSGSPDRFSFKPGTVKGKPFHFSYSGIKTAVLYTAKGQNSSQWEHLAIPRDQLPDLAASFQDTVLGDLAAKAALATQSFPCRSIVVGGGVANNRRLRALLEARVGLPIHWPTAQLTLDNAGMIAGLGYHKWLASETHQGLALEAHPRLSVA